MQEVVVTDREEGKRLDHFLGKYLDQAPKGFFYKMLRKKNIVLNGKKALGGERLKAGDKIKFFLADETIEKFRNTDKEKDTLEQKKIFPPEFQEISVVYEDEEILLLNKPVGVLSQKAGAMDVSLVEWLQGYLKEEVGTQNIFKAGICNRLDRNTSGLVAAGKKAASLQYLNRLFKERELKKYYLCLVVGDVKKGAKLEGYLDKSERGNKVTVYEKDHRGMVKIQTEYEPVEHLRWKGKPYTLLRVHLITGKSHQIRAHLAKNGHFIVGDWKYGREKEARLFKNEFGIRFQLLHAWKLVFSSPSYLPKKYHGREWTAPLPQEFERVLKKMREESGNGTVEFQGP